MKDSTGLQAARKARLSSTIVIEAGALPMPQMVKDINPGSAYSFLDEVTDVDGTRFSSDYQEAHVAQLWKRDSTVA